MSNFEYPKAHRDDVIEDYHGNLVADPYRWMEDPFGAESQRWITEQNQLTADFIAEISARPIIKERMARLYDMPRRSAPTRKTEGTVWFQNDGLQNQDVMMWAKDPSSEGQLLLDPNTFSEDGTTSIVDWSLSPDSKLLAYSVSVGGSDWQQITIYDIEQGEHFEEILDWCKFTGIAWHPNGSGFYYSRFPAQESHSSQESAINNMLMFHRVGTPQDADDLIFDMPDHPERVMYPFMTDDDELLMLHIFEGSAVANRLYYRSIDSDGDFVRLFDHHDAHYNYVGKVGNQLYIQTDLDAPNKRIIIVDVAQPEKSNWHTVIAEGDDPIDFATIINHQLVIGYLHNAHHQIKVFELDGSFLRDVPLSGIGTVSELRGRSHHTEMYITFKSYLYSPSVFRYDFSSNELTEWFVPQIPLDRDHYTTQQVWYTSKDGTQVSMFLTYRKDLVLDGSNPTLLYGYGGFNAAITPDYDPHILNWLEMGGIYAVAHLRGGSEYGEVWHRAGMLENKQNVYDDFIAAAEYLIAEGYTRSDKLAIMGRSNGGLLVATCMIQRPDLYGAVICVVPVTDMMRFHKFTAGRFWTSEYGNAEENPEHFDFMYNYSPLHNIQDGQTYPPILITSADKDDRVVPLHAMKFTATLQAADSGKNPILLRMDVNTGHKAGKPVSKWIDEWADIYSFLHRTLVME